MSSRRSWPGRLHRVVRPPSNRLRLAGGLVPHKEFQDDICESPDVASQGVVGIGDDSQLRARYEAMHFNDLLKRIELVSFAAGGKEGCVGMCQTFVYVVVG